VLVIRPRGVIERPGEKAKARMVEVHDQVAADYLVLGPRRGEVCRLATEKEKKLFREYEQANQDAHRKRIAGAQARTAVEGVNALLGQLASAAQGGAPEQATPVPPPQVEVGPSAEEEAADLVPEVGADASEEESKEPAPADAGLDPDMAKLGAPKHVKALIEAGYSQVEQVAEADPAKLTEIHGIGPATASKLMVEAAEIVAARGDDTEGGGEAEASDASDAKE